MPNKGDNVLYVCHFDADSSYSPNVCPAVVTKVNDDGVSGVGGTLDLTVFFINGSFTKQGVRQGDPTERETWHPKP